MRFAVHDIRVDRNGVDDQASIELLQDLALVDSTLVQGIPVLGAWFEARILNIVRKELRPHLKTTHSVQLFDPVRPRVRSRSWDIAIYDPELLPPGLPPAAADDMGPPLLPVGACLMVIDTKTVATDVDSYAGKLVYDKDQRNDVGKFVQSDLLGRDVRKVLLFAKVTGGLSRIHERATAAGYDVYALSTLAISGRIQDGFDERKFVWSLVKPSRLYLSYSDFLDVVRSL